MAFQALIGLDMLCSAATDMEPSRCHPQVCGGKTTAEHTAMDDIADSLLTMKSQSIACVNSSDESASHHRIATCGILERKTDDEETESDATESDEDKPEPTETRPSLKRAIGSNQRPIAHELEGSAFQYNGVKIPLYTAEIDGRCQTLLVPGIMIHEMVKHWDSPSAQKEARRLYVNKLLSILRQYEHGAVFPGTFYIDLAEKRNSRYSACSMAKLVKMLAVEGSAFTMEWVRLVNRLMDTPSDKKPPQKRKRDADGNLQKKCKNT
jgi:hypothetical protein